MDDTAKLNAAAYTLMKDPNRTVSRVISTLMQDQLDALLATQPDEVQKRENAYHAVAALKNVASLLENMSATHEAGMKNSNPA